MHILSRRDRSLLWYVYLRMPSFLGRAYMPPDRTGSRQNFFAMKGKGERGIWYDLAVVYQPHWCTRQIKLSQRLLTQDGCFPFGTRNSACTMVWGDASLGTRPYMRQTILSGPQTTHARGVQATGLLFFMVLFTMHIRASSTLSYVWHACML